MSTALSLEIYTSADTTNLRNSGGWREVGLCWISVQGPDAGRFLQSQSTNDVNKLGVGDSHTNCFIDRKSRPIGCFQLFRLPDQLAIICDTTQADAILEHLEKFKFADRVDFEKQEQVAFFTVQGPKSRSLLKNVLDGVPPRELFAKETAGGAIENANVHIFKLSLTGEEGFIIAVPKTQAGSISKTIAKAAAGAGIKQLDDNTLEAARIEAGLPKLGVDFSDDNLLAETTLDETAVSYSKGCFQGQEVLARIRSQGAPTRALVGMIIEPKPATPFAIETPIEFEGETIGWLKSNCHSDFLKKHIAIAMVKRDYRTPGKTHQVKLGDNKAEVTISLLPFHHAESPAKTARQLYEEALAVFAKEDESEEKEEWQSIKLLKEALMLDPLFEDAYESLGVILSKRGQLDEAIELMEYLTQLNPDSVMAHTNLSVFYIEKGWKEKAEEEKAISMSIRMRMAAAEVSKAKQAEEQRKVSEKETLERMAMFQQVLEIDDEDQLANYGLGDCLVALSRFDEAVPRLKKALVAKPTHTAGYLVLGQAYEGLKQTVEARQTYETGIDVAAKRGDMEPLKKMQERLERLQSP